MEDKIDWGTPHENLPTISCSSFASLVADGFKLIVIHGRKF
jgi:hypothetical protein